MLSLPEHRRPVHKEEAFLDHPEPCRFSLREVFTKFPSGYDKRWFGIVEQAVGFEKVRDLPEQFTGIRNLVDHEDGEGDIDRPVHICGKVDRVGLTRVRPDPWQEAFRSELMSEDLEHLLLEIDGDDRAFVPDGLRKLPGKEARSAAEVKHGVSGFYIPFCEPVRPVEEPPEASVKVTSLLGGEYFVVGMFFTRGHEGDVWVTGGDNGLLRMKEE